VRKTTWALLIWNVLTVVLIIAVVHDAHRQLECIHRGGLQVCNQPGVEAALGVTVIVVVSLFGDLILGILLFVTNRRRYRCPACGQRARSGQVRCKRAAALHRRDSFPPGPSRVLRRRAATSSGQGDGNSGGR